MARRLNLWDFDDTLAWSNEAVEKFKAQFPDVEQWKWWHDDDYSTQAALVTLPIEGMWEMLGKVPGDHWILTGRNKKAVVEWIKIWRNHPDLGKYVRMVDEVLSTSGEATKHIDIALKKQAELAKVLQIYDVVHVYDDRRMNLEMVSAVSNQVYPHLVENGRIVNASVNQDAVTRELQIISNALTSIQGLESVSDKGTYKELFRSTVGIIKKVQKDLVDTMSTEDVITYVLGTLQKGKIEVKEDPKVLSAELDRGHQVPVVFRFEGRLKDFYGHQPQEIHRAAYSIGLNIETSFDKLQSPVICKVGRLLYTEERVPVGYETLLWKVK